TYAYSDDYQVYDDTVAYDTVYYDESEQKYRGLEDKIVNNYYINLDDYSISPWSRLVITSGYYDPYFAWDYYWYRHSWCSPTVYFDGFYFGYYWRPYYYDYWYNWGSYYNYSYNNYNNYYDGYNNYGTHPGKTRDNDGGRRTRNDGRTVTNSFGNTTRDNTFSGREVLKDREKVYRTEDKIRKLNEDRGIPTDRLRGVKRDVIVDRENNNNTNRKIIIKNDNGNRIIRDTEPRIQDDRQVKNGNRLDDQNNRTTQERKKIYIKRDNEDRRTVERKTDRNENNRNYEPQVNQERTNTNKGTDRNRNYEPPVKQNRENPPTREYRRQEPPRNYNPPVNNNSGNNSRGDNGSSRNSGSRERR
ncbi:MAG TPA: hypothetical protein PL041_12390, partial [Melioribacteraceae bacterium]|nr:hypothetical protein [Melioribacteraceae bacterium]